MFIIYLAIWYLAAWATYQLYLINVAPKIAHLGGLYAVLEAYADYKEEDIMSKENFDRASKSKICYLVGGLIWPVYLGVVLYFIYKSQTHEVHEKILHVTNTGNVFKRRLKV